MTSAHTAGPGVAAAAKSGVRLAALEAIRDHLAVALDASSPAVAAQIAGQLRLTLSEIAELGSEEGVQDDLKALREFKSGAEPVAPSRGRRRVAG